MKPLQILYAGTPEFAGVILRAILQSPHQVSLVMTQPDRPAGRGMKTQAGPVKAIALQEQIPLIQPASLKLDGKYPEQAQQAKEQLEQLDFDVMVVAAYGLILPTWLLDLAQTKSTLGCINVHASLLPRWRGAAPIHRAILAGDEQTGTCIMKMAQGLDTGPILLQAPLTIHPDDTTQTLHDRLAHQGATLLVETLNRMASGQSVQPHEQSLEGVTYAQKILKEEALMDWQLDAKQIDRQVRALNPSPGAMTHLGGQIYKLWLSQNVSAQWPSNPTSQVGEIIQMNDLGIDIACGTGVIRILELQKAGGKKLASKHVIAANQLKIGDIFD